MILSVYDACKGLAPVCCSHHSNSETTIEGLEDIDVFSDIGDAVAKQVRVIRRKSSKERSQSKGSVSCRSSSMESVAANASQEQREPANTTWTPDEYSVCVMKEGGLGIQFREDTAVVVDVFELGAIGRYNATRDDDSSVKRGDKLVSVNGVRSTPEILLAHLHTFSWGHMVELTFKPGRKRHSIITSCKAPWLTTDEFTAQILLSGGIGALFDETTLEVVYLSDKGSIHKYNSTHVDPREQVRLGDILIKVNGDNGTKTHLLSFLQAFKAGDIVSLTFRHGTERHREKSKSHPMRPRLSSSSDSSSSSESSGTPTRRKYTLSTIGEESVEY